MPPDTWDSASPATWLTFAQSDLEVARRGPAEGVLCESLCFHAQQAIERSLKAVVLQLGLAPPRTHIISALIDLIGTRMLVPPHVMAAASLSGYAVDTRYPGDFEPLTEDDYVRALEIAQTVFDWARERCLT